MASWSRYLFIALSLLLLLLGVRAVSLKAEADLATVRPAPAAVSGPVANSVEALKQGESILLEPAAVAELGGLDLTGLGSLSTNEKGEMIVTNDNRRNSQADCFQFVANGELNVIELGDGTGTVEPWVILDPIVYYWRDNTVSPPNFSLFTQDTIPGGSDEQEGDNSPNQDMFGQGFLMPDDLVSVSITYNAATVNLDQNDRTFGVFWHVDANGNLPNNGIIEGWESLDPMPADEGAWLLYTIEYTDAALMAELSGNTVALVFVTETNAQAPDESVFFDNITMEVCTESRPVGRQIYLPNVLNIANAGPVCVPPSESPRDEVNANRGLVQTGALCQTTMSQLDAQDYYTFRPQQSGNYTLQLRNLPPNTEWSGSIIQNSGGTFEYAPGPTGGQCRIATPGAGNKQVICNLQGGREYVVKVSAGGYSGPEADYEMRVVR